MNKPTAFEYRLDKRIDWDSLGLPDPDPDPDIILQGEIDDAWAYIASKTCLDLDTLDESSNLGRLALKAIKLRVLQQAFHSTGGYLSGSFNNLVKSFTVPGYSETKYDMPSADSRFKSSLINENPDLADLIWSIMTEECRQKLLSLLNDENEPFSTITEIDWFYPHGRELPGRFE